MKISKKILFPLTLAFLFTFSILAMERLPEKPVPSLSSSGNSEGITELPFARLVDHVGNTLEENQNINHHRQPSEQQVSRFIEEHKLDLCSCMRATVSDEQKICLGLSIDGGGIRGYMAALWSKTLETRLIEAGFGKVPLYNVFDHAGGTSIGGILALGVGAGKSPDDLINFFEDKKKRESVFSKVTRWIDWYGLYGSQYDPITLEKFLKAEFQENSTLQSLRTNVLVTACTVDGNPWIFDNKLEGQQLCKVWEVGRCTSAAPTYFPAFRPYVGKNIVQPYLIDGGLWTNNPAMLVTASIVKEHQGGIFNPDTLRILSLGTGEAPIVPLSSNAGKREAGTIIELLMSSSSKGTNMTMTQLLGDNYYRVNPVMEMAISLDDTSQSSINRLKEYAQQKSNQKIIGDFVKGSKESIRKKLERGKEEVREMADWVVVPNKDEKN